MNLSDFAINEFVPLIIGDKKGKDLVAFFNKFGARDVYDEFGLPDIKKNNGARPSKREYVLKRAKELNGKPELRDLIINVVCQYPELLDKCNEILIHEKFQIVNQNGEIIVIGGVIDKRKPVVNEACFQDIQNRLLEQLNKARVSITVVMAWFTNETLFQKLLDKQEQGVDVKIAIYDDGVNKKHGVNIDLLPIVNKIKHGKRGGGDA